MADFSPSFYKENLVLCGFSPRSAYGQNYLTDLRVVEKMIVSAGLPTNARVAEIGPGFGILTLPLLATGARVTAFEIEKRLSPYWEKKADKNLEIVWGNALKTFPVWLESVNEPYYFLSNLPYNLTSTALTMVLGSSKPPARAVFLLQKEVVERIVEKNGHSSVLSLMVRFSGRAEMILRVGRGSFSPPPKVDSAVLLIDLSVPAGDSLARGAFFRLVSAAFVQPRRQIHRNLASLGLSAKDIEKSLNQAKISPSFRPEQVSFADFLNLFNILSVKL